MCVYIYIYYNLKDLWTYTIYASFPKGNDDNFAKFAGMLIFLVRMTPQSQVGDGDTHMILLILEEKNDVQLSKAH